MAKFSLDMSALTNVGKVREKNEDAVLISKDLELLAVADGMGGHNAGEVASSMSIETLHSVLKDIDNGSVEVPTDLDQNLSELERKLLFATNIANLAVFKSSKVNLNKRGMGTTLSTMLVEDNHAAATHVGDSRIYLYRNDEFAQITTDHCLATEHVEFGLLKTNYDLSSSRMQNILTRALGLKKDIEIDIFRMFPEEGDLFLLCSDGLNKELKDDELKVLIKDNIDKTATEICQIIMDMALSREAMDNISIIIMKINKPEKFSISRLFGFKRKSKPIKKLPHNKSLLLRSPRVEALDRRAVAISYSTKVLLWENRGIS
ncbi:MAG: serine/threonine-protein phosphatase [Elusimicrobiaceae bacterium]|jgi:PPM family protein phosphatase|nr:serine/threonine-protein phosphatase [Elusimicrobiaceae bacterium]MBT4007644.1 serine/threonine-protein phosphatase [Elusimicrobiaceae bacterium]MBT4402359.1 serine/threonine-protein phosphatase [Elusimicrobiaceae bacterium]MBT5987768.1 serine/threonine-protein phosphatase [Elusimicrobiaceae bacterium]MBT6715196.1 serine/threonine-protein phosphatase [Elusimicrobiaceae bacterium]